MPSLDAVDPLGDSADPRRYVPLASSERALHALEAELRQGRSPVLLTGASGTGKTLLLRVLAERACATGHRAVFSPFLHLPPDDLARWLLHLLGRALSPDEPPDAALTCELRADGARRTLLLLDEAQCAPAASLRLLRALGRAAGSDVALVLAGSEGKCLDALLPALEPAATVSLPVALPAEEIAALCDAILAHAALPAELRGLSPHARGAIVRDALGLPARLKAELECRAFGITALEPVALPEPELETGPDDELELELETDLEAELELDLPYDDEPSRGEGAALEPSLSAWPAWSEAAPLETSGAPAASPERERWTARAWRAGEAAPEMLRAARHGARRIGGAGRRAWDAGGRVVEMGLRRAATAQRCALVRARALRSPPPLVYAALALLALAVLPPRHAAREAPVRSASVSAAPPAVALDARIEPVPVATLVSPSIAAPVQVQVNARPWAHIRVDGVDAGPTPLSQPLAPGRYEFEAVFPDGRTLRRQVEVGPQQRFVRFP